MPDETVTNSWDNEETGLLDDYTGTIVEAWFGVDANYNPDATLLFWKFKVDDPPSDLPDGETTERFPVGKGWQSFDGGDTIEDPERPGRVTLHAQSTYRRVIRTCLEEFGMGTILENRGSALNASVWQGLKFHMARKEFDYGGEIGKKSRVYPAEFLGVEGEAAPAAAPATNGSAAVDEELLAELKRVRADASDFPSFVDAAMELPGVVSNGNLVRSLASQDGLWTELAD